MGNLVQPFSFFFFFVFLFFVFLKFELASPGEIIIIINECATNEPQRTSAGRLNLNWIIKRKPNTHVLILVGGSCNLQPCFRGGSVIFVPQGGGGLCVFYQPHFQMLPPPYTF